MAMFWPAPVNQLKADGVPIDILLPKKGVPTWIYGVSHTTAGNTPDQEVYDWIDAWLAPESGGCLVNAYDYLHSNRNTYEIADPAAVKLAMGTDASLDEFFERVYAFPSLSVEVGQKYQRLVDEVMSGV